MKRAAFTLVELLVVISIIGLLSTIAIVSMAGSKDKAAIAAGLQFEASVQHAAGSEILADWEFDDGSGTTASDTSGNGKNATLTNGPTWRCASTNKSYTPSGQGCVLNLDGVNDYVSTPAISLGDGTISLWFNNQSSTSGDVILGKRTGGCFGSAVYVNPPNNLQIYNGGPETAITNSLQPYKWYNLVVVRTGSGAEADFYLNGRPVLQNAYNISLNDLIASIGSSCAGGNAFGGYIDNVRVYGIALGAARIERLYAEEKSKYESPFYMADRF
jgi:prepilin-type N-terminal cleavage/methylation domain-containing protein